MSNPSSSSTAVAIDIPDSAAVLSRAGGVGAAAADNVGGGPTPTSMDAEKRRFWTQPVFSMFTALKCMVTLALGLAALKYEGSKINVFDENPVPAWCFLLSTWWFFLIAGALKANFLCLDNGIWFDMLIRAGTVCGLTSIMSSISIFIPRRYSFLPLVPVLAVAAAVLAWPMLHYLCNWILNLVGNAFGNIRARVTNWWGNPTQGSSLPIKDQNLMHII